MTDETEDGRRLSSEREDLIARGADPSELLIPIASPTPPRPLEAWWVISGESFREALRRAAVGEDPDLLYTEFYANSDTEGHS